MSVLKERDEFELDDDQKTLLYLLRCAVHQEKADPEILKRDYPGCDWEQVMNLAREHNILPLAFCAAQEVPDFTVHPSYPELTRQVMVMTAGQMQRTEALLSLYRAFAKAGVRLPLVMKGLVCRELYGEWADFRPSADEDLLIPKEDFRAVERVLLQEGYRSSNPRVTERQLEDLQEVSFYHVRSGLHVELHVNAIGHENAWRRSINDFFSGVFERSISIRVGETEMAAMSHTDHFLFLVLHALKHLTDGGVGLRQLADIALYGEKYSGEINWELVWRRLGECRGVSFLSDVLYLCREYLGILLELHDEPCCPRELLFESFSSGVFGNATQEQRTAKVLIASAITTRKATLWSGPLLAVKLLFPGWRRMLCVHPELKERPWLLPVYWMERFLHFIQRNRRSGGTLAVRGVELGKRRIRLLRKYGLAS